MAYILKLKHKHHFIHSNPTFYIHHYCLAFMGMIHNLYPQNKLYPLLYLLKKCNSVKKLKQIHSQLIQTGLTPDPIVQNHIISFCCVHESGDMNYARLVYDTIHQPNVYICNTMIKGYYRIHCYDYAVCMYMNMLKSNVVPDDYAFPFLLKGFTRELAVKFGKVVHAHVVKFGFESNVFVQNSLVHMYLLGGEIDIARKMLDMSLKKDVITWNAVISGYNRNQRFDESMKLFQEMEKQRVPPTSVTLVSVLSACSKLKDLDTGRRVHRYVKDCQVDPSLTLENALISMYIACGEMGIALEIFESMKNRDVISWTAMVTGHAKLGQLDQSRKYFDQMPEKDFVSWTAMIDGYVRMNEFKEVLTLFRRMQSCNVKPDQFTLVSVLTACAHLGALELGEWINAYIHKNNITKDAVLGNALIDMYFKCGHVEKAFTVYNEMPHRDKFTWTVMIVGLANNGHGRESFQMFYRMIKASVKPDKITYIGVLCACTHAGLVGEGRKLFTSMTTQHGIEPSLVHYGCMVDLLGRAGFLTEAREVIVNMSVRPNSIVWGVLLGACRVHRDAKMGELAAREILELEPENEAVYVMLCNIYASCKQFEKLRELRKIMTNKGMKKTPGCSLIEMGGEVHEFVVRDQSHHLCQNIYTMLLEMRENLKFAGYVPDTSQVFLDTGQDDRDGAVYQKNEKVAISFS